jgi:hypothetical protein
MVCLCGFAAGVAGLLSCGRSPAAPEPASVSLQLVYTSPSPDSLPPMSPDAGMCAHHYAPSNLALETSWGETGRLQQVTDRVYSLQSAGVPAGQDHWLSFVDITLCPTGTPRVTQGVTINGVELTRVIDRSGIAAMAFRLDASGRVVP